MPPLADAITPIAFSLFENKGVFALLLGSGLSRAAHIMTGWEITIDLIKRVGKMQGAGDQPDWSAWYRAQTNEEPDYSKLVEQLGASPAERRAILQPYIEPTELDRQEGRKTPTAAHRAIARLIAGGYIRVIITTNFDRLLEIALADLGIQATVIASLDALQGAEPFSQSACYILKVHGDYKDARIRNTLDELENYEPEYNTLLDRIFDEHGLIVCGWSGEWDHALRAAIKRCSSRRYSMYWATVGKPGSGAQELINLRKAVEVPISGADAFFPPIEQRVATLDATRKQNPRTVDLLVQTAKRFLPRAEHRIQLEELLAEEAECLVATLDGPLFVPLPAINSANVTSYLERSEGAAEPLACICGTIGRWGTPDQHRIVLQALRMLHAQTLKVSSGLTRYLELRPYPAGLILASYGVALTHAEAWGRLHETLTSFLPTADGGSTILDELVRQLCGRSDAFKIADCHAQHRTPVNIRLNNAVQAWGSRFLTLATNSELIFCRYEWLAAMTWLERVQPAQLAEELATQQTAFGTWVPLGIAGFKAQHAAALYEELKTPELKSALLAAGFTRGDDQLYDQVIDVLKLRAQQFRYSG